MRTLSIAALAWLAVSSAAAQASPCESIDACRAALAAGRYDDARAGLSALGARPATRTDASLALARLHLETGGYDEAAALVRPLAAQARTRVVASTLLGEA
ncbi:MAG: tetratricopeptide repeat protein, partial [Sandaracinaceae bacterium]|nr:tetratricopeptide repeat protein [Sandaracinaceae bacterium]